MSKDANEAGTSVERQRESIEQWTKMHGHEIIGWAHDTVSGSVSPFDAPELGAWLSRPHDWDALVAYRLDRLSRRVIPLNALFGFIHENGKTLASVSESLDLSTWIGRLVANVIAGVAEGELEAISERNLGSQRKVRQLGRWHGGTTPYGYTTEQRQDGWYLVPDPDERRIIRELILPRVLAHESSRSIARVLNQTGIPTRKGGQWSSQVLRQVLRGRSIIGQAIHQGRVVTDDDGLPLQRAEPILTHDEWRRVNEILDSKTIRVSPVSVNPLQGILSCYWCSAPMYYQTPNETGKVVSAYYRCSRRGKGCAGLSVKADVALELAEWHLIASVGDVQRRVRVFVPGSGESRSAGDLEAAIAVCRRERDLGLYDGDDEGYLSRIEKLVARKRELESLPKQAGFEMRDLGETYAQAWERMDAEERRTMLLDAKIQVKIGRRVGKQIFSEIYVPEEIEELLAQ